MAKPAVDDLVGSMVKDMAEAVAKTLTAVLGEGAASPPALQRHLGLPAEANARIVKAALAERDGRRWRQLP